LEPPPRLAPSVRSGLFSGDGIVAAGRKQVFSRVAEARAAAARADRLRVGRSRVLRVSSPCGSTASVASVAPRNATTSAVSFLCLILMLYW
jgi:hypothetical protein